MININNKRWDKLRSTDIEKLLMGDVDENFFFEFKADDETPAKLIKEISALSNTYGGYILLGVNDDKTIGGCQKWTEQRIHTAIHDSMTPIPNFDVKKFKIHHKTVLVIKIEEGSIPPYITNKGEIYERVSSGSFPIKDSSKLTQLYSKRIDQIEKIKSKIELEDIDFSGFGNRPNNLCAYLDLGFSTTCSELTELQKDFYTMNLNPVATYLRSLQGDFSIARLGQSFLFTIGRVAVTDDNGNEMLMSAGINNFIEIMCDGSVRCRIILASDPGQSRVNINHIMYTQGVFREVYTMLLGQSFAKTFVHAHKYEKLRVLKQFVPYYNFPKNDATIVKYGFNNFLSSHQSKYGNNLIVEGNRFPKNDYILIDKRYFSDYKVKYNIENLVFELFRSAYYNLGFIDPLRESD